MRRVREFLARSQAQLARVAGVSRAAVSRLEADQGLATPFLVVVKVQGALAAGLRAVDRAILGDELRAMAEAEHIVFAVDGVAQAPSLAADPGLDELIRLYRGVPARPRAKLLAVFRTAVAGLWRRADDPKLST